MVFEFQDAGKFILAQEPDLKFTTGDSCDRLKNWGVYVCVQREVVYFRVEYVFPTAIVS